MTNRLNTVALKLSPLDQTALLLTTAGVTAGYLIDYLGLLNLIIHVLFIIVLLAKRLYLE